MGELERWFAVYIAAIAGGHLPVQAADLASISEKYYNAKKEELENAEEA